MSLNTNLGTGALANNSTGSNLVAVGGYALTDNTSGNNNTAIGANSQLFNTTGSNNVSVGPATLMSINGTNDNTAIGANALEFNANGVNNTAIGSRAGYIATSGNYNTFLGAHADVTGNNYFEYSTAIGYGSKITADHQIVLGTSDENVVVLTNPLNYTANSVVPKSYVDSFAGGATGPAGPAGPPGNDGLPGTNGMDGLPGINGTNGLPGAPGVPGSAGAPGPIGYTGAKGGNGGLIGYMNYAEYTNGYLGVTYSQIAYSQASDLSGVTAVYVTNGGASQLIQEFLSPMPLPSDILEGGIYTPNLWISTAGTTGMVLSTSLSLYNIVTGGSTMLADSSPIEVSSVKLTNYAQSTGTGSEYSGVTGLYLKCDIYCDSSASGSGETFYISYQNKTYYSLLSTTVATQGPPGPQGIQGNTGLQGIQGIQGLLGPQGAQGLPGQQGPQGVAGAAGLQGPRGDTGPQGPSGNNGLQGIQGLQGPVGPTGPPGNNGSAGGQGIAGPAGPAGATGPAGSGTNFDNGNLYSDYLYWDPSVPAWTPGSASGDIGTVHIGPNAGSFSQSDYSVAIGANAGYSNQGELGATGGSIAIGAQAGYSNQGINSIAIGPNAGYDNQGDYSIAIGRNAQSDFNNSVAIGQNAVTTAANQFSLGGNTGLFTLTTGSTAGSTALAVYERDYCIVNTTNYTNIIIYKAGTYYFNYNNTASVQLSAVGAGGGGAGAAGTAVASNRYNGFGGGGGGGIVYKTINANLLSGVQIVVGAGGAGGAGTSADGTAGSPGAETKILFSPTNVIAYGGGGGRISTSSSVAALGGDPGSGTGGITAYVGNAGGNGGVMTESTALTYNGVSTAAGQTIDLGGVLLRPSGGGGGGGAVQSRDFGQNIGNGGNGSNGGGGGGCSVGYYDGEYALLYLPGRGGVGGQVLASPLFSGANGVNQLSNTGAASRVGTAGGAGTFGGGGGGGGGGQTYNLGLGLGGPGGRGGDGVVVLTVPLINRNNINTIITNGYATVGDAFAIGPTSTPACTIQSNSVGIKIVPDCTGAGYNDLTQAGDAVIVGYGSYNNKSLTLTSHSATKVGVRITPTQVQISGGLYMNGSPKPVGYYETYTYSVSIVGGGSTYDFPSHSLINLSAGIWMATGSSNMTESNSPSYYELGWKVADVARPEVTLYVNNNNNYGSSLAFPTIIFTLPGADGVSLHVQPFIPYQNASGETVTAYVTYTKIA